MADTPFLSVKDLTLTYRAGSAKVPAVNRVSFEIPRSGQALAVVGESGCGKSSLALAILRSLPKNVSEFSGEVRLDGKNLMTMSESQLRKEVSWKKIAWVPQSIASMFNPVYKVGKQIEETLKVHQRSNPREETLRLLDAVGLNARHAEQYPHQLSGGMQQRACIALALALRPPLVILDEPTSALDVSLQGEIINLLKDLREEFNLSYLFITHNIVIAAALCDLFAVIYAGRIVERGTTERVLANPQHPYTKQLLACVPTFENLSDRAAAIPGEPPDLRTTATGCPFFERPAVRCASCSPTNTPELVEYEPGHFVACHGVCPSNNNAVR